MKKYFLVILGTLTLMLLISSCQKEDDITALPDQEAAITALPGDEPVFLKGQKPKPTNSLTVKVDPDENIEGDEYTMYVYAPNDNDALIEWGGIFEDLSLENKTTLEAALADFDGEANTQVIVAELGNNNGIAYAARICAKLNVRGIKEWYLPSLGELHAMYVQLGPNGSGEMPEGLYWSSTEYSADHAWFQFFHPDINDPLFVFKDFGRSCRCVRK